MSVITLKELRAKIDQTDEAVVTLLNERAALVLQVKDAKEREHADAYSPEREREIVERVKRLAGAFPANSLEIIFREVVSATRSLIGEIAVSYLGPEYSLGHNAALKQFGNQVRFNPCYSVRDLFQKVEQGMSSYGVVPLETNTHGLVATVVDCFLDSPLQIVAEILVKESLDLVGKGIGLSEARRVYGDTGSYSVAMDWLRASLPAGVELLIADSSSSAVRLASEGVSAAALVPSGIADRYGLTVLASGIAGPFGGNARYLVVGRQSPSASGRDKTSLLCSVADRAGALCEVLAPFQKRGVNLTKIDSTQGRDGERGFLFFVDLIGHCGEKSVADAIGDLRRLSTSLKVLGSYPVAV